jgi:hypothetical protein
MTLPRAVRPFASASRSILGVLAIPGKLLGL